MGPQEGKIKFWESNLCKFVSSLHWILLVSFCFCFHFKSPEHASGISSVDELPKISKIDRTQIEKWLGVTPTSNEWQEAKRLLIVIFLYHSYFEIFRICVQNTKCLNKNRI